MLITLLFHILLPILLIGYVAALAALVIGISRIRNPRQSATPLVSVIVAARNEEKTIGSLLQALRRQNYPDDRYEIIIVNDQSDDATAAIVAAVDDPRLRLLTTENRDQVTSPKKHALNTGIRAARGEILLFTDADCAPPSTWVRTMVQHFDDATGMVIGYSPYELPKLDSVPDYLLAIESLSLAAVAAGTTGLGYPATCSGRNLGYRKTVFKEVGGFSRIMKFVSGDDDMFLKLVQETDWRIRYLLDPDAVVPTHLLENPVKFFHQRIRHASKGFHYEWKKITGLVAVYLFNFFIFISFPVAIFSDLNVSTAVLFLLVKAVFEFWILVYFGAKLKRLSFLRMFPLAELLHVPYVVVFGLLGSVADFNWKK